MMRAIITYIGMTVVLISVAMSGPQPLPKDYRYPTDSDRTHDWEAFKKETPTPFHARADYNGDGRDDDAWILLGTDGPGWGLFVFLSTPSGSPTVLTLDRNKGDVPAQTMGVGVTPKGSYPTACGKGYWACEKGEPETLHLTLPAINYFKFESADSVFWWNSESKQFIRTWKSD
jgi:hypothetical protein